MGIRPEFRWWVLTIVVVGVLLLISALALDRPNVVWDEGVPHCPHCRSEVAPYSVLCRTCGEHYDWKVAPPEASPLSHWSLTGLEARHLRERVAALGETLANQRVAHALGIPLVRAQAYLELVDRGRCGWCGGTGRDLAEDGDDSVCPVCFGTGNCIACGGDRRIRVGDEAAHEALVVYREGVEDAGAAEGVSLEVRRPEVERLTREFVRLHAGTEEATQIWFWPTWPGSGTAVDTARERLDLVLKTLAKD